MTKEADIEESLITTLIDLKYTTGLIYETEPRLKKTFVKSSNHSIGSL